MLRVNEELFSISVSKCYDILLTGKCIIYILDRCVHVQHNLYLPKNTNFHCSISYFSKTDAGRSGLHTKYN